MPMNQGFDRTGTKNRMPINREVNNANQTCQSTESYSVFGQINQLRVLVSCVSSSWSLKIAITQVKEIEKTKRN